MYWRQAFPGRPEYAATVRRFVAMLLRGCPYLDDLLLVVDELVVNAMRHTRSGQPGGTFGVEVACESFGVAVTVTDLGGPTEPAVQDADLDAESGRGLAAVALTAVSWGWHGNASGRAVTAVFPPVDPVPVTVLM